jgi:hypothetical protein
MKKHTSKSVNMYIMFGLLAVLFVSLGYLSMQTREGMEGAADPAAMAVAAPNLEETLANLAKIAGKKDKTESK